MAILLPRLLLLLTLVLGACSRTAEPQPTVPGQPRPLNILLITADDLGRNLGTYGDPLARTPKLDQLAAEGVLFERAYVTQASCSPSRASLLTGLYPSQHGHIGLASQHPEYRVRAGTPTLPALLQAAGYFTAIIGKLHIEPADLFPFDREWPGEEHAIQTRDVRAVAEQAARFLRERGRKPFFLYVNYFDPHRPFDADANQYLGLPATPLTPDEVAPLPFLGLDGPWVREETAAYYNSISRLDTGVGLLLQALRDAAVLDDTLVVFVSDHGPPFSRAKATSYEAGEAVPLILRWPGVSAPGLRVGALVSTVDLMPTLLQAAQIKLPPQEGRSLRVLASGGQPEHWRGVLFTEFNAHSPRHFYPRRAARTQRFRLIHNLDSERANPLVFMGEARPREGSQPQGPMREAYRTLRQPPEFELYDLLNDPHETRNLAAKPAQAERLQNLQKALLQWRQRIGDPLLDPAELARLRAAHGID